VPDKSGNYENLGGIGLPKCPKLNGKSKLNSLVNKMEVKKDDNQS